MGINCTILSTFCTFEKFHHIKKKQKKKITPHNVYWIKRRDTSDHESSKNKG